MRWLPIRRRKSRLTRSATCYRSRRLPRLESLESRNLLTATLGAAAVASIQDNGQDGVPEQFTTGSTLVRRSASSGLVENRAVIEFDLQPLSEPVNLAVLDFRLAGNIYSGGVFGEPYREFDLFAYSGDGATTLADFDRPAALVRHVGYWAEQGGRDFRLDVTQELRDAVLAGYTHWGLRFHASVDIGFSNVYDETLTVNGAPALTGQRSLETVPNAVRADGVETFRVEVDVHGEARAVTLEPWGNLFMVPGSGTLTLRDDGQEGDRAAGDFVYTSGEFRFNPAQPFPTPFYQDNTDSPPGVSITDVGIVKVTELDGAVSTFFNRAQVALLRPDLPTAPIQSLGSDIAISDHLINVRTAGQNTQRTLRGPEIIPERITKRVYQQLPDEFDFFNLFSTQKVEQLPFLSGANFVAGRHVTVQMEANGTGVTPFNNSATFGSGGRLSGINLLDAFDRGIWGANATHELVHQWSAYLSPTLGISEFGGHFLPKTNVGSLVGGQQWLDNGDGSFTINFAEGRNGATYASPLDRYLMGLADRSEVSPLMVYSSSLQKSPDNPIVAADEIVRTTTIDDIIAQHGLRTPGPETARRDFRIGFIAESDHRMLTPTEMTFYEILAAHYTKAIPQGEPTPYMGDGWSPVTRFFGEGASWSSLVPGRSETTNHSPVAQGGTFTVPENAASGTVITVVPASDEDPGQQLVYGIKNDNQRIFLIDPATGRLTVNKALNREGQSEYVLSIVVADTGIPSQADTVTVTIRVADVNEFPPVITPGQTFTVEENSANGTIVGMILATDEDAEAHLQDFTIVAGNSDNAFAFDPATGALRIADGSKLNFEAGASRVLQVTVGDGTRTSQIESVTVQLTDVNESPQMGAQTFSIKENRPAGTVVGTVAASDPDSGQTLTYSIVSGNTGNAFALDAANGRLTVNNSSALNFEVTPTFNLTVNVTDNGNPSRSTTATITVLLIDEIEIAMDIDPGDSTNTINIRKENRIAVAILSSASFNATNQVNFTSLRFGKTGAENSLVRDKKSGKPLTEYRDVNGDGILDLVAYFETSKTGLAVGDLQATLNGSLTNGTTFQLTGSVKIVSTR